MSWILLDVLFESPFRSRLAYRSGRREIFGLSTRRDMIGFEKKGERKIVPKRKRPKKFQSLLNRTGLKAKIKRSRG